MAVTNTFVPEDDGVQKRGLAEYYLKYYGKIAKLTVGQNIGIKIEVRIVDLGMSFNRVEALVVPLHGEGSAWVTISNLSDVKEKNDSKETVPNDDGGSGGEDLQSGSGPIPKSD